MGGGTEPNVGVSSRSTPPAHQPARLRVKAADAARARARSTPLTPFAISPITQVYGSTSSAVSSRPTIRPTTWRPRRAVVLQRARKLAPFSAGRSSTAGCDSST